jgi:hypothetical protein
MPNKSPISLTVMPSMVSLSAKKSQYISVVDIDKTSNTSVVCNSRGEHTMTINIKGYDVLIDDEDFDRVMLLKWSKTTKGYFHAYVRGSGGKTPKFILLHRYILNAPDDKIVDHISGNTYDNRKSNLRLCTQTENSKNNKLPKNNTSGYKGVSFDKSLNAYVARIVFNGNVLNLGRYKTAREAFDVYDAKAKELFGEFYRSPESYIHQTKYDPEKDKMSDTAGVFRIKQTGKYGSRVMYNKKFRHLGTFDTVEEAHQAYCEAKKSITSGIDIFGKNNGTIQGNTSGYNGVAVIKKRNKIKYCAYIRVNKKNVFAGTYFTPEEAHQKRMERLRELYGDDYVDPKCL